MDAIMDQSIGRLPDPVPRVPPRERRRCIRQKLHTPVYASFNGSQNGVVVDLSELLDLNEDGFAVQTSERLEVNRAVTLSLDLPETRNYIHGSGVVIWSDDAGRGGIRFSGLPESSRQALKEWLFANLLIACANHVARTEQRARWMAEESPAPVHESVAHASVNRSVIQEPVTLEPGNVVPVSDGSDFFSALEAVRIEVRGIGDDVDAIFQLITERALNLTGATGAALAFLTHDKMICRAQAGAPAPPLGAPVDARQGLSGECVCTGLPVSCVDMQSDPRVDPEIGRVLGIGSLMAFPIVSDFRVLGLLEIFSPHPHAFTKAHGMILGRLIELIPKPHPQPAQPEPVLQQIPVIAAAERISEPAIKIEKEHVAEPALEHAFEHPTIPATAHHSDAHHPNARHPETPTALPSRLLYRALLGLVIVVVATVVGYLVGPAIEKQWATSPQAAVSEPSRQAKSLAELQNLADHGNADAQWQIGVRYHSGEGVPQNDSQAMLWFQLAAEQGNVAAQSALGSYYWAGRGVPEDLTKAYMWSAIALAGGDQNSKSRMEGLASQMTPPQISAARQQAEAWIRIHSQPAKSEAN